LERSKAKVAWLADFMRLGMMLSLWRKTPCLCGTCANRTNPLCFPMRPVCAVWPSPSIIYFADLDTLWLFDLRDLAEVQARIGLSASSFGCMLGTTRGRSYGQGRPRGRALKVLRRWNQTNNFVATPFALTRHQHELAAILAARVVDALYYAGTAINFKERNTFMESLEKVFLKQGLRWAVCDSPDAVAPLPYQLGNRVLTKNARHDAYLAGCVTNALTTSVCMHGYWSSSSKREGESLYKLGSYGLLLEGSCVDLLLRHTRSLAGDQVPDPMTNFAREEEEEESLEAEPVVEEEESEEESGSGDPEIDPEVPEVKPRGIPGVLKRPAASTKPKPSKKPKT
jgi:hypothetical protein